MATNSENSIGRYLSEVDALQLKYKGKKTVTTEQLVESHLQLVVRMAEKYKDMGVGFDDLVAEGNVALVMAANNYKEMGCKFTSYAFNQIRKRMLRAIADYGGVVKSTDKEARTIFLIKCYINKFVQKNHREPETYEIVEYFLGEEPDEKDEQELRKLCGKQRTDISEYDDSDDLPAELIADDEDDSVQSLMDIMNSVLTAKERTFLMDAAGLNGEELSGEDLAKKYGCSKRYIWALKKKIIGKLVGSGKSIHY